MIYSHNTTRWKTGDIVIHDSDAKTEYMLMLVVGYDKDGKCVTRYCSKNYHGSNEETFWHNRIEVLHDPKKFGIEVKQ